MGEGGSARRARVGGGGEGKYSTEEKKSRVIKSVKDEARG